MLRLFTPGLPSDGNAVAVRSRPCSRDARVGVVRRGRRCTRTVLNVRPIAAGLVRRRSGCAVQRLLAGCVGEGLRFRGAGFRRREGAQRWTFERRARPTEAAAR